MNQPDQQNLQPSFLLSSDEFKRNSEHIIKWLKIPRNCETANDLRQEMAIAVMESLKTYNPDKIGKNFWGHANLWMSSRARTFILKHGATVRVPVNRRGGKHWEKMGYSVETVNILYFDEWCCPDSDSRVSDNFRNVFEIYDLIRTKELSDAIETELSEKEGYIIMVRLGWKCTKNRKNDFKSISEDLGIKTSTARLLYKKAKEKLVKSFSSKVSSCEGASCAGRTS
jgi:RNA polymerase sigma factor (sigma-70 family)